MTKAVAARTAAARPPVCSGLPVAAAAGSDTLTPVSAEVVIYTTSYCGFCHAAKRLLNAKSVSFEEIDVGSRQDLRQWLVTASGQRTVPQVFINGDSIGGYSELSGLESAGELDGRLSESPSPSAALRR